MQNDIEDRFQIADLINGWIHRDLGQWDQLRKLFHPDGVIEVTWFEGLFGDFVDGSMRMGKYSTWAWRCSRIPTSWCRQACSSV